MSRELILRVKGERVAGSVLGPKFGPLGRDSKAVAVKLNAETAFANGRKVYVKLVVDGRDWQVSKPSTTDVYLLKGLHDES